MFAKCDDFMSALMQRLQQDTPPFLLKRRVKVTSSSLGDSGSTHVTVAGLDNHSDKPYSFIKVSYVLDTGNSFKLPIIQAKRGSS